MGKDGKGIRGNFEYVSLRQENVIMQSAMKVRRGMIMEGNVRGVR